MIQTGVGEYPASRIPSLKNAVVSMLDATDPSKDTLFRPLTRQPQATTLTVRELIRKVEAGELRVPSFQRPLRWDGEDVRKLLDSIVRGYPIGSLLFWKRAAPEGSIRVGGATLQAPAVPDAWWVVDGQQRVTAIAASLLELDHAGDRRWLVRFDPQHSTFLPDAPPPEREGLDAPLSVLGDLRRLGRWMRSSALSEEAFDTLEETQKRLLDYAIPVYIVETEEEEALRGVFARLNSTGARMRSDEVFQALFGSASNRTNRLDLDGLQAICQKDAFGSPSRADVMKAVLAMSGVDPTRTLDDLGNFRQQLVSYDDAADALQRTVDFLRTDGHVPHVALLPYPVVFVILSRWFHVFPECDDSIRRRLAQWLWRGAIGASHQRAAVSAMREQVRDIADGEQEASCERLLSRLRPPPDTSWQLGRFTSASARSRIETLALLSLSPSDAYGPLSLSTLANGERIAREIFASRDCRKLDPNTRRLSLTIANRVLLDTVHTGLHSELRKWDRVRDAERLRSHAIDEEAFDALLDKDLARFLRHRHAQLSYLVADFARRRAAWDEPILQPMELYLDAEDEEGDS
ncbi:MAG: DUF262 domain-containing protein [Myxococcota bacterium]|jgi:hypothetical protein|nr:DUF262 domain-containing protein [Myxococcota bacterium]